MLRQINEWTKLNRIGTIVRNLQAELKEKNQQKKAEFEAKVKEDELAEIAALKERFNHLKQDLVQDTVKEVLKRYGNS